MTPTPPATGAQRVGGMPPTAGTPPASDVHVHDWAMLEFELVDGRPFVRQACRACATVRQYPAWERYWDPAAPGPGAMAPSSTARHPASVTRR